MHLASHPFQVEVLVTYCSVLVKHLVEFTQFEQN
jgi:hypothetical protein